MNIELLGMGGALAAAVLIPRLSCGTADGWPRATDAAAACPRRAFNMRDRIGMQHE